MEYSLEEICLKITDGSHFSPKDYPNSEIPMLSVKDMREFDFDYKNCKHISEEDFVVMKKQDCVPLKDDILVAKDGSYLKEIFVNQEENQKAVLSSIAIFRPNPKLVSPYFLCYLLKSPQVMSYVKNNCVSGSALPRVILKTFKGIKLDIPSLDIQEKIVKIIKDINEKIELNNQINDNLYEIIKLQYTNFIENITDYEVLRLKDIALIGSGKRPKVKGNEYKIPLIGASGIMSYTDSYNYDEDIIIIGRVGTLGVVQRYFDKIWASDNTLTIKTDYKNVIENYMKDVDYISLNRGSTQPLITQTDISNLEIKYNKTKFEQFEKKVKVIREKIYRNNIENNILAQLRDVLLPKLMNGEIDLVNIL